MGLPSFIEDEIYQAIKNKKAIQRIRELHHPFKPCTCDYDCDVEVECDVCGDYYPCETIKVLDGIK